MRNLVIPVRNLAVFVVLLLAGVSAAIAQTSISGTVKDLQGEPLIGVSVVEKGHQNGATTDIDGNFVIRVAENATLQFSYVGLDKVDSDCKIN